MKINDWQRIAASGNTPVWYGDHDDDCSSDWAGFLLQAEWMDGEDWWWAVIDTESGEDIASSNRTQVACTSGEQARQAAENAVRAYVSVSLRFCTFRINRPKAAELSKLILP